MAQSKMIVPSEPPEKAFAQKKFDKWCKLFLDPKSSSYGNATQSALRVYKVKNYYTAGSIGSQNYNKLKDLGLAFVEQEAGISVKEWWKILAAKAVKGTYEQTADLMQRLGIMDKPTQGPMVAQQFNFGDLAEQFTKARQERGLPVDQAIDK